MLAGPSTGSRPKGTRTRSSTIVGAGTASDGDRILQGHPAIDPSASSLRISTLDTSRSNAHEGPSGLPPSILSAQQALTNISGPSRPRVVTTGQGHYRGASWPSPPTGTLVSSPSAPTVPTRASLDGSLDGHYSSNRAQLVLYTYKPSSTSTNNAQPTPLPATPTAATGITSTVLLSHASLPWHVEPGDYLEIRRIRRDEGGAKSKSTPNAAEPAKSGGEALRGVAKGTQRDGYVFRLGEDAPNVPGNQIQVPESVAAAFKFQHRLEVEVVRVSS